MSATNNPIATAVMVMLVIGGLVATSASIAGAVVISEDTVEVDSDTTDLVVELTWNDTVDTANDTVDVIIANSTGTEVVNETKSPSAAGATDTYFYDPDADLGGLDTYDVRVEGTDETVVNETDVWTEGYLVDTTLEVGENETIFVDVEFNHSDSVDLTIVDDDLNDEPVNTSINGDADTIVTTEYNSTEDLNGAANYTVQVTGDMRHTATAGIVDEAVGLIGDYEANTIIIATVALAILFVWAREG